MEDEIISHDPVSSMEDEIAYDDLKKEAIEKEWRDWLKAYENHSNWIRDMSCYEKLQNLMYQSVEGECWAILVEAYEKVPLARKARMPNCYPGNQTALHLLVARPSAKDVVEQMLSNVDRDDVKIKDEEGNTVLHAAAEVEGTLNIDRFKLILSYFPDLIEECNDQGKTALSLFTRCCHDRSRSDSVDRYEAMINSLNHTTLPPHSTPLHVAADVNSLDAMKIFERVKDNKRILKIKDEKGNTPLHFAAKHFLMEDFCKSMADVCPELVYEANCTGESPLFIASKYASGIDNYKILCKYIDPNIIIRQWDDGNTILHHALLNENFVWAYRIVQMHSSFGSSQKNKDGLTPLKILANIPSAFKSRTPLTMVEHIIYSCIWVLDLEDGWKSEIDYCREALSKCFNIFKRLIMSGSQIMHKVLSSRSCCLGDTQNPKDESESAKDLEKVDHEHIIGGNKETSKDTSNKTVEVAVSESDEERPIMVLIKSFMKTCMPPIRIIFNVLINIILPDELVWKIESIKRKHMLAYRIMQKLLLNYEESCEDPSFGNATVLIAAEKGVTEIVEGIFRINPRAYRCIRETDSKNAVHLAIENRQADVYEFLITFPKKWYLTYNWKADREGNNALHFAATRSSRQPWGMPTTMQLLWEIKWYNYVRDMASGYGLSTKQNKEGKTPSQVFWEEHKDLLQKNDLGQWLNTTSQSCSVVAGLVATVAYSSATSTPGGNSQEGVHNFKGNPAFGTFVISAFTALCFSLISLVMFLSILISPYRGLDDANKILPRKLVVALGALLLSTGTMFISFCAGHFFFLEGKLTYAASPFYAIGCLLVGVILVTQFDSYTSLLSSLSRRKPRPWYDDDSLLPQLPPKS